MTDLTVRVAQPRDEEALYQMCAELHAENGQHTFDGEKVRGMLQRGVLQQGGIIGVVGDPGDLKAAICMLLDPVWYSSEFQLLELFNFVRKDSRSGKLGLAQTMISYAKTCADELNIDLTIGVLSNIRMEAKVRIYGRLLPKAGEFFVYSPPKKIAA
jgi:hypothetical protein